MSVNIAIITARGGSKRIPQKNIKEFLGTPIIAYSIKAAIDSGLFDEVMVSTDSEDIANIAGEYGAAIPFTRGTENSGDFASTADVLLEVLECYVNLGKTYTYLCCIYPTAPFVTPEKLCAAFSLLKDKDADAVIPVVPFSYPPLRGLVIEDSYLKMKWPENIGVRSQDLDTIFHDSGQFYFVRVEAFLNQRTLFCKKTIPMVLSQMEVQDIDNETDWKLAELKYRVIYGRENPLHDMD